LSPPASLKLAGSPIVNACNVQPLGMSQLTRRGVLRGATAFAAAQAIGLLHAQNSPTLYAYVGCYTSAKRYARGDGIHVYRVDPETAAWTHIQHLGDLVNPSFLEVAPGGRFLFAVHGDESYASSFTIDRTNGQIAPLNRAATGGNNGVHMAVAPGGRFLVVANYSSGTVAVMPVAPDGTLADATQIVPLPGQPGPNRVEQASSHPHHIVFDPTGRFVVVPDKGLDRVFVFAFDAGKGTLTPTAQGSAVARSGSGPRHAAFHPSLSVLWVLNEISSTVTTYYWEAERGHLWPAQILTTLPTDFTGENTAAEIAVSAGGKFVYCSNRGHDSVALFAADPATGLLTSAGWVPSQGRTPRFIGFDPSHRHLYGANEQSDTIVTWRADRATGDLTRVNEPIHNASPVSIAFAGGALS
jgi:6-phosphogluconolactonase